MKKILIGLTFFASMSTFAGVKYACGEVKGTKLQAIDSLNLDLLAMKDVRAVPGSNVTIVEEQSSYYEMGTVGETINYVACLVVEF